MNNNWSVKEVEILKEHYESSSKEEIIRLLPNRKWSAIRAKAHKMKITHKSPLLRFYSNIYFSETNCWIWMGSLQGNKKYGLFCLHGKRIGAHRASYEIFIDSIPLNKEIDHLCKNSLCVNPLHLEIVTHKENLLRGNSFSGINSKKTHCVNGHKLDKDNLYIIKGYVSRVCKECRKKRQREYSRKRRDACSKYESN